MPKNVPPQFNLGITMDKVREERIKNNDIMRKFFDFALLTEYKSILLIRSIVPTTVKDATLELWDAYAQDQNE
jgi:hypothetical protein